jgi:hypothetical protein
MRIHKGLMFGVMAATVVGVVGDSGEEAYGQAAGMACPNCPPQPQGCTVGCIEGGDCNTVGHTIPPGYQWVHGTFALQVNKLFGVPNPSPAPPWGSLPASVTSQYATHYVTAVNGGGPQFGGPNSGPQAVSFHTNATTVGAWERFTLVRVPGGNNAYMVQTANGQLVTFMNGGGVGGPNDATAPIHTDAYTVSSNEKFTVSGLYQQSTGNWVNVTFKTSTGYYLTAVGGGGIGAPSSGSGNAVVHTDTPWGGQMPVSVTSSVILAPQ